MINKLETEAILGMVNTWLEMGSFKEIEPNMKDFKEMLEKRLEEPKYCNHRWRMKKPAEGEPLAPNIYCAKCGEIQLHDLTTLTGVMK